MLKSKLGKFSSNIRHTKTLIIIINNISGMNISGRSAAGGGGGQYLGKLIQGMERRRSGENTGSSETKISERLSWKHTGNFKEMKRETAEKFKLIVVV